MALSGGGVRAAAFGIGVLQGLSEIDKLRDVDVLSGVSGGAYAVSWYSQRKSGSQSDLDTLSEDNIERTTNPDLLSLSTIAFGVAARPLNFLMAGSGFANGIDAHMPGAAYYAMLGSSFDFGNFSAVRYSTLRTSVEKGDMPLPIIGISAYPLASADLSVVNPESALSSHAKSVALYDTYMEVTPFRLGIPGFGFRVGPITPLSDSPWHYVTFSGAAYDQPHKNGSAGSLDKGIRLGGLMSMITSKQYPAADKIDREAQLSRNIFYTTDGGFVENLATYPLVMRRCETIIIADSEYDPEWVMEGYRVLKYRLALEHGLDLRVKEVDELIQSTRPIERRYTRADGVPLVETDFECARPAGSPSCRAREAKTTVFEGALTMIPLTKEDVLAKRQTRIIYLKLGMPKELASDIPSTVTAHISSCMEVPATCHFPQDVTFNRQTPLQSQRYTRAQFQAYKDLARSFIKQVTW